jgi:NADH-quinone oxidoreductase subunit L
MTTLAWLVVLMPLAGFLVLVAVGRRIGDPLAGWVATAAAFASFGLQVAVWAELVGRPAGPRREVVATLFSWLVGFGLQVHARLLVDPLSVTMALFVTGVGALIHLYSLGYMRNDPDYPKFFLYMNLFLASMLLLVLGGNLVVTFVGWEGVGLCSYLLIAYWFERPSAASAGKKAFVYNRLGDVGFLLAMFLVFERVRTLDYLRIFAHRAAFAGGAATAVCLLLFLAATGKSAQIPLFPWLPDAMEGPTPVSALIHAATMVTAGVYLMCRMSPLLAIAPDARLVVAGIGAATAFVAATIGCAQDDIKRVIAYSTVSQLGYMFLAVGTGAYEAAIFLMVAHAFFKALLFLGSGSVIHALHDEQDLKRMGGLARRLPVTVATFAAGWLALAAVPPLSGFWAKGDVLEQAFGRYPALWAIGVITALLTAYYSTRLFLLVFAGEERWRAYERGEPHEAPPVMTVPLVVLALLAIAGGLLGLPFGHAGLGKPLAWLDPLFGSALYHAHLATGAKWALALTDAVVALVGVGLGIAAWGTSSARPALEPTFLVRKWFVDELYDALIGRPAERLANAMAVEVDERGIDGAVLGIARIAELAGRVLRRVQTGFVRQYALAVVLGVVGLLAFMLSRAWS